MPRKKSKGIKKGINLLQKSTSPKTFWEKFYIWALTVGRFIIVGTEAIVLTVFIARFKLDRDVNDIADSLDQKAAILYSYVGIEEQTRNVQALMEYTQILTDNQPIKANTYKELIDIETEDVTIESLLINNNILSIEAIAEDIDAFNDFEETYKRKSDLLYDVTISRTEKSDSDNNGNYEFNLRANIKTTNTSEE